VSGAASPDEVKRMLSDLGFEQIVVMRKEQSEQIIQAWNIGKGAEDIVFSAYIHAIKP